MHSRCSMRKDTSDCRAAGFVAGARPIGMLTSPKLIDPFHVVRIVCSDSRERVSELANGLLALGIRKGDAFGILAATRLEWLLFDYALALVGAVTVPVYATSSPDDCAYALDHVEAIGVMAEDPEQVRKLDEKRAEIPRVRHIMTFADLDDLAARGRAYAAENPGALDQAFAAG